MRQAQARKLTVKTIKVEPYERLEHQLNWHTEQIKTHAEQWAKNRPPGSLNKALYAYLQDQIKDHGIACRASALTYLRDHRAGTGHENARLIYSQGPSLNSLKHSADYLSKTYGHNPQQLGKKLAAIVQKHSLNAARDTVMLSTKAIGSKYCRVPEAGACWFCLMLGARGPVYRGERSARFTRWGDTYHAHCRCGVAEVIVGKEDLPKRARLAEAFWKKHRAEGYIGADRFRALVETGVFTKETGIVSATLLNEAEKVLRYKGPIEGWRQKIVELIRSHTPTRRRLAKVFEDKYGTPLDAWAKTRNSKARTARLGESMVPGDFTPVLQEVSPNDQRPTITWEDMLVNAVGKYTDKKLNGAHLFAPPNPGKSVCPEQWTFLDMLNATFETIHDPQLSYVQGDARILRKDVNGIIFEVRYYSNGDEIVFSHCVPLNGSGVRFCDRKTNRIEPVSYALSYLMSRKV